ncbi:hypothetical protein GG344DRAFT_83083 [Lentinula edodes]|nr:hypothetical protein GG344DRAFT_83083 [Lentinula edodes]
MDTSNVLAGGGNTASRAKRGECGDSESMRSGWRAADSAVQLGKHSQQLINTAGSAFNVVVNVVGEYFNKYGVTTPNPMPLAASNCSHIQPPALSSPSLALVILPLPSPILPTCPPNVKLLESSSPLPEAEAEFMKDKPYQSVVGCIMWGQVCTRPDLAFTAGLLYITHRGVSELPQLFRYQLR